ncbi:hypothetical protein [Fictibacillus halophilus]|uniref:hypothetical protein n=1 Tax=Fictibacillus halophilus TaxID=1610490 RepID=UPI001CFA575F|nr:hypothetical protein [Fictibacillus halophilus]
MPTDKANIFTIARFGDITLFKNKFVLEKINEKDEFGIGLLHHSIAGECINPRRINAFLWNLLNKRSRIVEYGLLNTNCRMN